MSTQQTFVSGVSMTHARWRQIGVIGFAGGGILFAIASAISFTANQPLAVLDAIMTGALTLVLLGVGGLYALQKRSLTRFGRVSFLIFLSGLLLAVIGTGIVYAKLPFASILFVALPLTWLGGLLGGIATYRTSVFPNWSGVLLAIAFPGAVPAALIFNQVFNTLLSPSGAFSGAIVPALCWFGLTYVLWKHEV